MNSGSMGSRERPSTEEGGTVSLPNQDESSDEGDSLPPTMKATSQRGSHGGVPSLLDLEADDEYEIRDDRGSVMVEDGNMTMEARAPPTNPSEKPNATGASRALKTFEIEESRPTPLDNPAGDDYLRNGTWIKMMVGETLQNIAATLTSAQKRKDVEGGAPSAAGSPNKRRMGATHARELAREKATECMILKKKLEESEAGASALSTANSALREAATASSERLERTVEALRIAGANAANARADADAAEAYAASLATQLKTLRNVVDETKRSSESLYQDHERISAATRSLETNLLQRETEFLRSQHEIQQLHAARDKNHQENTALQREKDETEAKLNDKEMELRRANKEIDELKFVEGTRKARLQRVEKELSDARSMLVEASATAAETEGTVAVLKETIEQLRKENETLHGQVHTAQDRARQELERLEDCLTKVEKEAQSLREKESSHNDTMQKLRSEKLLSDKQVSQLKSRIIGLERKLKDASSVVSPPLKSDAFSARTFTIPPLTPAKERSPSFRRSDDGGKAGCCLCGRAASGLMKSCQCGDKSCGRRAHSTCIAKATTAYGQSVSHPGSAIRQPVILCQRK